MSDGWFWSDDRQVIERSLPDGSELEVRLIYAAPTWEPGWCWSHYTASPMRLPIRYRQGRHAKPADAIAAADAYLALSSPARGS